ncbi:MAG: DUF1134 domain-containing protein [Pseudomonadota bacterium]
MRTIISLAIAACALMLTPAAALAQACGPDAFAAAVDKTGADLRKVGQETRPKIEQRLEALAKKRGWKTRDAEAQFVAEHRDAESDKLDAQANALWTRLDVLSEPGPEAGRCERLAELRTVSDRLVALSLQKARLMLSAIDAALEPKSRRRTEVAKAPAPTPATEPPAPRPLTAAPAQPARPSPAQPPSQDPVWETETSIRQKAGPAGDRLALNAPPSSAPGQLPAPDYTPLDRDARFTAEDISNAGRGFFGSISAELASVIEYAFSRYGAPSGYILGSEGGGALIAGLRYGQGKLVLASGGTSRIFWQGPSVGYDFGITGTRAMFLVYGATDAPRLYQRFIGVEGSAFIVGGVGLTVHRKGDIILAPIRSGLGLRVGASVGYLKFSPRRRFNPF